MEVVGPTEAARLLGVKRQSLKTWIESGDLTPIDVGIRLSGRPRAVFMREEVIAAARKRRAKLQAKLQAQVAAIPEVIA